MEILGRNIVKKLNLEGTCGSNSTSQSAAQLNQLANNLTIDVSGDIFGCGADATVTGPDGLMVGMHLKLQVVVII